MMSFKTRTIQKSYRILRTFFHFYKLDPYVASYAVYYEFFSAIYIFPVLGFQGPLRLGSEEEWMRYVLNLVFVCEKPRKNVGVGFNGDAFSISFI